MIADRELEITITRATHPTDFSLDSIRDRARGLDIYNGSSEVHRHKRMKGIVERRPLIEALDTQLRILKTQFPPEERNKKGSRKPSREYRTASQEIALYRRQLSQVQSADRLTLKGKL